MIDHRKALAAAADKYREARPELQAAIRAAYADGMRQADILRAIDHVWSREYVRQLIQRERSHDAAHGKDLDRA